MKETLTSISMNFSNGSGHTASTTSVRNAKSLSGEETLGAIIGNIGKKVNFSDKRVGNLFSRFAMTEQTISKDSVKTTVTRKYVDQTSLRLKSHFIAVRGKDIAPDGSFDYNDVVFDYAECPNAPLGARRFGYQPPSKRGGALIIGNIYNEIQETNEISGQPFSLVYRDGKRIEELCHNSSAAGSFYLDNPDLSKSSLKFGYSLSELRSAANMAGIGIVGLPNRTDILFENSGDLDSVLGSVAGALGMYWYVNPLQGTVVFVSSRIAASMPITNPLELDFQNIVSCSFTQNTLAPVIPCSYISENKPLKTEDSGDKARVARFKALDVFGQFNEEQQLAIKEKAWGAFYGASCVSSLNEIAFDAISFYTKDLEFGRFIEGFDIADSGKNTFLELYNGIEGTSKTLRESYEGPFNLKDGIFTEVRFTDGTLNLLPSQTTAFTVIKSALDSLNNQIYISNKYSKYKAQRMQLGNSSANVSGPYKINTPVKNVEGLGYIASLLSLLGMDSDTTLEDFVDATTQSSSQRIGNASQLSSPQISGGGGITSTSRIDASSVTGTLAKTINRSLGPAHSNSVGQGDFVFVAVTSSRDIPVMDKDQRDKYTRFTEKDVINWQGVGGRSYLGVSKYLDDNLEEMISDSQNLFEKRLSNTSSKVPRTLRVPYTRTKSPVNELLEDAPNQQLETALDDSDAEEDEDKSKITDLFDKKNFVKCQLDLNGASGGIFSPVSFEIKKGTNQEISALMSSNFGGNSQGSSFLATSSRTLVGFHVPAFKVTLTGITFQLSSGSVQTTINESTQKLLPVDDQIVTSLAAKSTRTSSLGSRFSASQKNFLGL